MSTIGNAQTEALMRQQVVATLAAPIIAAMGRPVSMDDVQKIYNDLWSTFFPNPASGRYEAWKAAFDGSLRYE